MMCKEAVEAITDAEEGALEGWRRLAYGLHMGMCPYCRAHRRQVHMTIDLLKRLPAEDVSESVKEAAIQGFRRSGKGRKGSL